MTNCLLWQTVMPEDVNATSTLDPVRTDIPLPDGEVEWNNIPRDCSPQLYGLKTRNIGSSTVERHPGDASELALDYMTVSRRYASSGYAAAKEAAEGYGQGTMQYSDSMEPTVRGGSVLGALYFQANPYWANEQTLSEEGVRPTNTSDFMQIAASRERQQHKDALRASGADWWR